MGRPIPMFDLCTVRVQFIAGSSPLLIYDGTYVYNYVMGC